MTVDTVAGWIRDAPPRSVTVLTGAGVSTDSGIPDFRGPSGVWTRDPGAQALFTLANYVADPALRRRAWQSRLVHPAWTARPNAAHVALAAFERTGRLRALVTQNIDGLHQAAGSTEVVEVHGTLFEAECLGPCGRRVPMTEALERVRAGEADPGCLACGGLLKSATISFGQSLDPDVWRRAVDAATGCSVFLAAGTSLSVQPVAGLARVAAGSGAAGGRQRRAHAVRRPGRRRDPRADRRVAARAAGHLDSDTVRREVGSAVVVGRPERLSR